MLIQKSKNQFIISWAMIANYPFNCHNNILVGITLNLEILAVVPSNC